MSVSVQGVVHIAEAFQTVALAQVTQAVRWLDLNDMVEVLQSFVPFLLENIDLTTSYRSLNVARILAQGSAQGPQRALEVVNTTVSDRKHDKRCLTVVRTPVKKRIKVLNRLEWLAEVEVSDSPVKKSVVVLGVNLN